MTAEAVTSLRS